MFNKKIKVMIITLSLLVVASCDKINDLTQPSPEGILNSFLTAQGHFNSKDAYQLVSVKDKKIKNLSELKEEFAKVSSDKPFIALIKNTVSFKILKITKSGNSAKADVEITVPNFKSMVMDMMESAFASAIGEKTKSEIAIAWTKKYKNSAIPTTTFNEEYNLVKEKDGWKVFLNWKAEKEQQEKLSKAQNLHLSAVQLAAEGLEKKSTIKMNEALQIYEQILELYPENNKLLKDYNTLKEKIKLIKKQGFWDVSIEINSVDDSKTVTLFMDTDSDKSKGGKKVYFIARCKNNSTEVFINWVSYLGRDANVLTRIGKNKAVTSSWSMSTDKIATFHKKPISFLKKMGQANKLLAQITPYNDNPITVIFDTTGLKNALLPLREACGW